jgi:aminoglycoside phosphotransferase (APT) family kinase protein
MIKDEHLAGFLASIATELEGSVRPHLTSCTAIASVESIKLVLGRVIAELQSGGRIAATYQAKWAALAREFPGLVHEFPGGLADPAVPSGVAERRLKFLDDAISGIQVRLNDPVEFDTLVASLSRNDARARTWLADTAHTLHGTLQNIEDSFFRPVSSASKTVVAGPLDDANSIKGRLGAYLARRFEDLDENCIVSLRLIPGGQVKRTALFELVRNDFLPSKLVLRQDLKNSITGTAVVDEYEIIKKVFELGLPVPEPLLIEPDASILGGPFMIMREIVGAEGAGTYFGEERRYLGSAMGPDFGREVAGVLARLHGGTLVAHGEDTAALPEIDSIAHTLSEWRSRPKPPLSIAMDLSLAWLRANPLPKGRPLCLIHGDAGAHNILTRDGHLAALLDWELAKHGDPAEDLAQAKMMLLDDIMPWQGFVRAYVEQGGPPAACDAHAIGYYAVRTFLKHGIMNFRVWDYFTSGARTDAAAASVASHFIDRIMLYLARALDIATAADTAAEPRSASSVQERSTALHGA